MKSMNYDEKRAAITATVRQLLALRTATDLDEKRAIRELMAICEAPKPVDESSIIRLDLECESVLHFSNCKKAELRTTVNTDVSMANVIISVDAKTSDSTFFVPGWKYKACIQHADE